MTDQAQRFLVVRLSSIGDIVHALPAVAALAETFPEAQIDWAVEKRHALLLESNPHVRRVFALDTLGWRSHMASRATWREARGALRELRQTRYDVAIDFQGLWKSAFVAWLSRSRERLGYAPGRFSEHGVARLYTQQVPQPEGVHVVKENLALVEHLGARTGRWQFPLPSRSADDAYVDGQLAGLSSKDFVLINPGGGWRSKCWSPEDYATLIREWVAARGEEVILTGSPSEEGLIANILASAGSPRARYVPTTLVQFIALARRARLFIGGDTGPLHLAAAVGIPIVGIYGPTDPARNGPFAPGDIALTNHGPVNHTRRGANPPYLQGVSVESVLAAAEKRLARAHE